MPIRSCFVPRPGNVFIIADYAALELRTLAQVCLDLLRKSRLAEVLNSGIDPHSDLTAEIMGVSYEHVLANKERPDVDRIRKVAKIANFGLPGGLGVERFVVHAKKKGVVITLAESANVKNKWLQRWPEMPDYFALVNSWLNNSEQLARVKYLRSNRHHAGLKFSGACNCMYQALGADATQNAGWMVAKACYVEPDSPLFGSRIVNYIHDEFILETPEGPKMHDAAMELKKLMIMGANEFTPDVGHKTEPVLARYWNKKAVPVYKDGRLVPWEPR